MDEKTWDDRLAEVLEVLISVGDYPGSGIVRDFVRRAARVELQAYKNRTSTEETPDA